MQHFRVTFPASIVLAFSSQAADLSGHKLLITSVRTGDTGVFIANPTTGDLFNVTRSPSVPASAITAVT